MSRLTWDAIGERYFETGIDRGVLYLPGGAHPWPGLVSIDETPTGGTAKPLYQDGVKYQNRASSEEFEATISAYASPPEFDVCDGLSSVNNGLFAAQQTRAPFNLSYRSKVGNDIDSVDHAYKIHLIYNALVSPAGRTYSSGSNTSTVTPLKWRITTLPPGMAGFKPTPHLIIDSRYTTSDLLAQLEDLLYGTDTTDASLPTMADLMTMFGHPIMDAQFPDTQTTQILDGGAP